MESEEDKNASVNDDTPGRNDDANDAAGERGKTPVIQRSVAFDLSTTDEREELSVPVRRVTIR